MLARSNFDGQHVCHNSFSAACKSSLFMTDRGEIARSRCEAGARQACPPKARRSGESGIAAEALMNNAG
ncbi:MAG: hypothetical protein EHM80_10095 [Nitrospiraceae bacterium]|nr:MAG: hypothetical protein EHM80_10095 [Nitrospiraceae bacterium]